MEAVEWMMTALGNDGRVVIHCVGGLGRSGMIAACLLKRMGLTTEEAIARVRSHRSPRAIETAVQEEFIAAF